MADATSPDNPLQQEVALLRRCVAALEAAQTAQAQHTQALLEAQELDLRKQLADFERSIEPMRDITPIG